MLYGKRIFSFRTVFHLLAAIALLAFGANTAQAATPPPIAPQLVPYTVSLLAGNAQLNVPGFAGDGQPGALATLNSPRVAAVDSVGNVYFSDLGSSIIREVNAQTGIVNTVVGTPPTACSGTKCKSTSGCADGVPAYNNPTDSQINGIAIDAYGNIVFSGGNTGTISVVYRGGAQMANFITLENPAGVKASNGVQPGYVYHVAGTINLGNCAGTFASTASASAAAIPAGDGNLAYQSAAFGSPQEVGFDSAGNIYVGDTGINNTIRIINTQSTSQTFFAGPNSPGVTIQPGYIMSAVNCGPLTTPCNTLSFASLTAANSGVGGPVGAAYYNRLDAGAGEWMSVDAYGNVYELNTKGAVPGIYAGVAYAGGNALGNMLNNSILGYNKGSAPAIANTAGLTATPGDFYYLLSGVTLRPSSITADLHGNVWYVDNHFAQLYRVDANAVPYASDFLEVSQLFSPSRGGANVIPATASVLSPAFCSPATNSTTDPTLSGYKTTDILGDGCPASVAVGFGSASGLTGYGAAIEDGLGQVIMADQNNRAIRKVSMNTSFPPTPVGTPLQQTIQVHFDGTNPPVQVTQVPIFTTSSFTIASGISDFTISPINTIYATAALPAVTGPPTCSNLTSSVDLSLDCIVNVVFTPTATGIRQSQLVVTTANGSVYQFGLTGIGTGPQLAIDGGAQSTLPVTGLGNPGGIAVSQAGTVYIADPSHNRVVVTPASGGAQTTIGTGLSGPRGVALDSTGNVYISDTGNNRIVEVAAISGVQTVLGGIVATGTPAYVPYTFNKPQGLAVDVYGNVYVADTGNKQIVEIPSNPLLGGATPLLSYTGAFPLVNPVSLALDALGNIYFADSGLAQVYKLPAGGGDLQNLPNANLKGFGSDLSSPSGVAIDAAGNVYISDNTANAVFEVPSGTGPAASEVALISTGLSSPGALALDASGNLYVADTGNSRILVENRSNPMVAFGIVPQDSTPTPQVLTVTNTGTQPIALTSPFSQIGSINPSGSTAFSVKDTCSSVGTLSPGLHCTVTPSFQPTSDGPQSAVLSLQGGASNVSLTANGAPPQVTLVLTAASSAGGPPVQNQTGTVTATATQTYASNVPSGSVSFTYTVDGVSGGAATVVPLTPAAGTTATAALQLPTLQQGRLYVVNAVYSGDAADSSTTATPDTFYIPGVPVTATSSSISFSYGSAPPVLTGTVTGIVDSGVTYSFVSAATATTPIGTYPVKVVFSGPNAANYGYGPFPAVVTASGGPAVVTETAVPLTAAADSYTTPYGAQDLSYQTTITGAVNSDKKGFTETYTPVSSSILNVGTYPIVPTVVGNSIGNYKLTVQNGLLTVTNAPTSISIGQVNTSVLPTALTSATLQITVATLVAPLGKGTPTGTVTLSDVFTPITPGAPGTSAPLPAVTIGPLNLLNGQATYTPTSPTLGTHVYTATYSGDSNFSSSALTTGVNLLVDTSDITVVSSTTPIQISPGVLPGGNSAVAGESAATPETATVTLTSILGQSGSVTLTCTPQNPSYVTCTLTPPTVALAANKTATSTVAISTLAYLPLGAPLSGELKRNGSETVLAFLPLGVLAFVFRKRKRLSKALWMLLAIAGMTAGMTGCGGNSVHFFNPIPQGAQTVTIFASTTSTTTQTVVTRSFTVPINIQ